MATVAYRVYICHGPTCSAHAGPLLQALERQIWACGLEDQVQVGAGGCQGRCSEGPNMLVHPGPRCFSGLTRESLQTIVELHLSRPSVS